ncbi:MAG TPA: hypothetical protein DD490_08015 [Acidobacteria bacterium]|nr:hypothetical protein [Acidobacteriota bacterium]
MALSRRSRFGCRLSLACLLASCFTSAVRAQPAVAGAPAGVALLPPDEVLVSERAVIGEVTIEVGNIFDPNLPGERRFLFRLANKLHRTTRDRVIEQQLLFKPGDLFSRRLLDESERNLRQNRYLYDVKIQPVRYVEGRVDVAVRTRDVWTLNAGAGLGRSGGTSSTSLQLQDTNFLGTGKGITLERRSTVDRTTSLFRYDDPAVLGSRARLGVQVESNSDGTYRSVEGGRPFYALETPWSVYLNARSGDRVESFYELGKVTDHFRHRRDLVQVQGGISKGLVDGWADRWSAGFTWVRDRFDDADGYAAPSRLPPDRTLAYPWISWSAIEDHYVESQNLDQIERTEDFHLGSSLALRLGWSSPAFGADRDEAIFEGNAETGFRLAADQTLLLGSSLRTRWGSGGAANFLFHGSLRYYWRDFGDHLFFAGLEGDEGRRLDPEQQILIGGDNGLRGYPLRYQDGDRRFLLTLEQRFFTDFYPFHLVHVGGAVFFDAGRTWTGDSGRAANLEWLKDVGVGLRLSSSRSGLGNVIHLDLAFPLDGDGSIQSVQWLVRTKGSF